MITSDSKIIKKHHGITNKILELANEYKSLSDDELKSHTQKFKDRLKNKETLEDILVEAYATVHEAARRITGLNIYPVQVIGGIVLHEGDVAEMRTGEGKTITSLMPVYLNAMTEKGVHLITVNDYLAERDAEYNGRVLNFLGMTVGLNTRSKTTKEKQEAYRCDVTYTTNSELGFDYLRDNMAKTWEGRVQRTLNYCIIDEADSVLIDEARTPLIISGGRKSIAQKYKVADQFCKTLKKDEDVTVDLETKQVFLTNGGVKKTEAFFKVKELFNINNTGLYHSILNALKANFVFKKSVEYISKDNEIILIDQHTGRLMEGRSYSDGLQQALQAKENVPIEEETVTLATITYQNFFRLYNKISGMTGTAKTEEEEFIKIYNMRVVCIPTNRPIIRNDLTDLMFATRDTKLKHLMKIVKELNDKGQPILIGTTSVDSSEIIAHYLRNNKFHFEMLNAKNHEREADIIAKAGQKNAITLATNMAGRGTDIKLGEGVVELGGLAVIGIERNEARRIDNQLRGRSGRQGDPGFSQILVAIDDDLIIRFGGKKLQKLFTSLKDDYLESRMLVRSITNAQKKIEGMNFDQRKNILDYDNILAQHREATYSERNQILQSDNLRVIIKRMYFTAAWDLTRMFGYELHGEWFTDIKKMVKAIEVKVIFAKEIKAEDFKNKTRKELAIVVSKAMQKFYEYRISDVPIELLNQLEKTTIIKSLDNYWQQHIDSAQKLRSGIYLRSYAQRNPLHAYVQESSELYEMMKINIAHDVVISLAAIIVKENDQIPNQDEEKIQVKLRA